MKFLSSQAKNGSFVVFIFNKRDADTKDILEQRISKLKSILARSGELSNSKIFVLNLFNAVNFVTSSSSDVLEAKNEAKFDDLKQLENFLSTVMEYISVKMKGMIFQFAHPFYQLLHSYYILLCKIISHKMKYAKPKNIFKNENPGMISRYFRPTEEDEVSVRLKALSADIDRLLTDGEAQIKKYKHELRELYLDVLKDVDVELQAIAKEYKTIKPYEENGNSWFRNVIESLQTQDPTPFEEEINSAIINHFHTRFSLVCFCFILFFYLFFIYLLCYM